MRLFWTTVAICSAAASATASVEAQIVYSAPCCSAISNSRPMSYGQPAMNFTLASATTITGANIYTYLYQGASEGSNGFLGQFDWAFFTDANGAPGDVLASGVSIPTPPSGGIGPDVWSFAIDPVNLAGDTRYWFSVRNTDSTNGYFDSPLAWRGSFGGQCSDIPAMVRSGGEGAWQPYNYIDSDPHACGGNQLAFDLYGTPTTTTPEPASFFLVGTGLLGVMPLIRRRSAAYGLRNLGNRRCRNSTGT